MTSLGKISKGINCSVKGCSQTAVRSLSKNKISSGSFEIVGDRRAYLCQDHYKEWKKSYKKQEDLERVRWQ